MKAKYYFLSVSFFLFSCSENGFFENSILSQENNPSLKIAGDGVNDVLGQSYDITDEYLGIDASSRVVLDINAFKKDYPDRFYNPTTTFIDEVVYAGATGKDFLEDIIKTSKFSGSVAAGITKLPIIGDKLSFFSASVSKDKETQSKYSYSSKYSFARVDTRKRVKRLYLNADVAMLSKYLTKAFADDLNRLTSDDFVAAYGTHVLTDITIGGIYTATYKSAITTESDYNRKKQVVTAGVKANMGKIGVDFSGSSGSETTKKLNTNNSDWSFNIKCYGGEGSGTSISLNPESGAPSSTFNLHAWAASVNDKNSKLIDVNWNATYPIYEFISNPIKKKEIIDAVDRYLLKKRIEVMKLNPLYVYSTINGSDYLCTTNGDVAKVYLNRRFIGIAGYVCREQIYGTIPLYEYLNSKTNEQFLTTNATLDRDYTYIKKLWDVGFVYYYQAPETIPLYEFSNKFYAEQFVSAYDDFIPNRYNYNRVGNIGYLFPR